MIPFKQFFAEAYQEISPGVVRWIDGDLEETDSLLDLYVVVYTVSSRGHSEIQSVNTVSARSLRQACQKTVKDVKLRFREEAKEAADSGSPELYGEYEITGRRGFISVGEEGSAVVLAPRDEFYDTAHSFRDWTEEQKQEWYENV